MNELNVIGRMNPLLGTGTGQWALRTAGHLKNTGHRRIPGSSGRQQQALGGTRNPYRAPVDNGHQQTPLCNGERASPGSGQEWAQDTSGN